MAGDARALFGQRLRARFRCERAQIDVLDRHSEAHVDHLPNVFAVDLEDRAQGVVAGHVAQHRLQHMRPVVRG